ncbi:hypothetical protein [Chitinolyticbacter meiyuanensis]|uniref:hypothetical protein n=1 Tax=Chitinolyticbacter meiyuanensis TaxID=682798 RepID=UPI0011E5E3A8|nr:hypothetical protein [Chitinolyticbacter meiyuanensis]
MNTIVKTSLILAVIGVVGFLVWLGASAILPIMAMQDKEARLLKAGVSRTGVIAAIAPTQNFVNNQPVAAITVRFAQASSERSVSFEQVIPYVHLAQLQPGQQVPLRVDPADDQQLIVDLPRLTAAQPAAAGG